MLLVRAHITSRQFGAALMLAICLASPALAQNQPSWYPPVGLYGRNISQPFFDFPPWARFSNCRPAPLAWGFDPFPNYGPPDCNCDCYSSINCPGDFVAHRPGGWYATADLAPRTIDYSEGFDIARVGPTGTTVLTSNSLMPEFDLGGKFTIGRRIYGCYRLEATYQGQYNWDDARLVTNNQVNDLGGTGNLSTILSGFSSPIAAGVDGASSVAISFASSFHSGEINLRYWVDMPPGPFDVSFLVGARAMRLEEQFNFDSVSDLPLPTGTTNDFQANTTNRLVGAQLGVETAWLVSVRTWLQMDLKGAMLHNNVDLDSSLIQNGGVAVTLNDVRNRTAFMGDLQLVYNWQMTPWLTFRTGYQAIWLTGVSLAQDQIRSPIVNNTPGPFDDQGHACIHGPLLGFTGAW